MNLFKRLFLPVLLFSVFFIPSSLAASGDIFPDVSASHENAIALKTLKDMEVIQGFPNGTFEPDLYVKRAEAIKIIIESAYDNIPAIDRSGFPDVDRDEWFAPYVALAKDKNIIKGYPDGTFRGGDLINFGEILKIATRTFGVVATDMYTETEMLTEFPEYTGDEWFLPYLTYASKRNTLIIENPGSFPTRAQMVELIYRIKMIEEFPLARFHQDQSALYSDVALAKDKVDKALRTSINMSNTPMFRGENAKLLRPFFIAADAYETREDLVEIINGLTTEADLLQTFVSGSTYIETAVRSSLLTEILAIKNNLAAYKNQLLNATGPFSSNTNEEILYGTLEARKDIVKSYGKFSIVEAENILDIHDLISTLAPLNEMKAYGDLATYYNQVTSSVRAANEYLETFALERDEFLIYADIISNVQKAKDKILSLYDSAYETLFEAS